MKESEFRRLQVNTVVKANHEESYWVVCDLDQFGPGSKVHGIRLLDSEEVKYGRLSEENCQFWQIVGKLK